MASAALGFVLLGGGAGACGTGAGSGSGGSAQAAAPVLTPAEAVAKAAEDSADITSLRYRITGSVPDRGRLTADAAMSTAPLAMNMELTTAGQRAKGPLNIRFAGKALYVGGSALETQTLGRLAKLDTEKLNGRSWLRIKPAGWGLLSVDNQSYGLLPRQVEGSPIVQSTLLTGSKNAKKLGAETIDGARTTHYRGTVTFDGLEAAQQAATDKASRKRQTNSLDQFIALGLDKNLTMDLWIDNDGRTRQFRMRGATYKTPVNADGEPLKPVVGDPIDMTVTFLRINEPVTVTTPPAADTARPGHPAGHADQLNLPHLPSKGPMPTRPVRWKLPRAPSAVVLRAGQASGIAVTTALNPFQA
ncbi:hypothetical protein [Streptomyces umbrinus]|uniref:hypothetical protein n=1 Tax=Streptomyces umbrinus TaxID=67370 RepID=UPI0027D7AA92|nr:hypothetical protein [Streptomyces umbrinus]